MIKKIIVLVLLIFNLAIMAQIDTTSWYPLEISNYWEFSTSIGEIVSAT